jgi:hypothetical protein
MLSRHRVASVFKLVSFVAMRDEPQACESAGLLVHVWGEVPRADELQKTLVGDGPPIVWSPVFRELDSAEGIEFWGPIYLEISCGQEAKQGSLVWCEPGEGGLC